MNKNTLLDLIEIEGKFACQKEDKYENRNYPI